MASNWALALALVGTSVVSALIAVIVLHLLPPRRPRPLALAPAGPEEAAFLFDGEDLVDATEPGQALLAASPVEGSALTRLHACLAPRFPTLAADLSELALRGRIEVAATGGEPAMILIAEWHDGLARLTLAPAGPDGPPLVVDRLSQRLIEDELKALRAIVEQAPLLVWRTSPDGAVTWANRAYLMLAAERDASAEVLTWPLPRLFDVPPEDAAAGATGRRRVRLAAAEGGRPHWFDLHSHGLGSETLLFGVPADAVVQAETALRDFVQTLTKTFAHLPIGLAIFDRRRELQLFNPALSDLTTLSPEFLSARPSLAAFLDRLRAKRMIPEPRDYKSWRDRISALETAAASGLHEETWTLPSGQTWRVTGRPHPDGAVAFLIEDISAEITLTRRFRAELEVGQAVVDSLDEAIAVFSPAGILVMSNDAYARLWGVDPSRSLAQIGIVDAMRFWQSRSLPAPIWSEAREFVATRGARSAQTGAARLTDGRLIDCRLAALPGGATLIGFRIVEAPATEGEAAPDTRPSLRVSA